SNQFMTGYHMPIQHQGTQQTPLRKSTVTSPNEVISTLVERVRGLELAQANQNSPFMQTGSSNPPYHSGQVDLLTGVGT
ncbi:hypothetical protein KI387_012768, partial [Taxus chinensis]